MEENADADLHGPPDDASADGVASPLYTCRINISRPVYDQAINRITDKT